MKSDDGKKLRRMKYVSDIGVETLGMGSLVTTLHHVLILLVVLDASIKTRLLFGHGRAAYLQVLVNI
jgi:hypothetical protein